ncbi:MAG: hypothetical protein ACRD2J_17450 [Thermoanaerobaculia bacterium]
MSRKRVPILIATVGIMLLATALVMAATPAPPAPPPTPRIAGVAAPPAPPARPAPPGALVIHSVGETVVIQADGETWVVDDTEAVARLRAAIEAERENLEPIEVEINRLMPRIEPIIARVAEIEAAIDVEEMEALARQIEASIDVEALESLGETIEVEVARAMREAERATRDHETQMRELEREMKRLEREMERLERRIDR